MDAVELIARFTLAAVFLVAGLAKLADRPGSRAALEGFGLPERLAVPGAVALPVAELVTAVLLIPASTATIGGASALALLLGFCAGIGRSMARGEAPDCHCFGQLHSEPVGWSTLLRNLVLAALAAVVLATGLDGSSVAPFAWIGDISAAGLAAIGGGLVILAILAAAASVLIGMLRRHGALLLRVEALEKAVSEHGIVVEGTAHGQAGQAEGLPVGSTAPAFTLPGVHGETTTLDALLSTGKPVLLVFTDPGCGPCTALLPHVAEWQRDLESTMTIALISRGNEDDNRAKAAEHGASRMFIEATDEVSSLYEAQVTPSAVLVDPEGRIASPRVAGEPAIRSLVESTLGTAGRLNVVAAGPRPEAAGPQIGSPAPSVELTDLGGNPTSLPESMEGETLLLFWNPDCGFCARALEDLRAFERARPDDAPRLLIVSRGSAQSNEAMELESQILLDDSFAAGNALASPGTPSAVLIDAEGKVASEIAAGADACFDLARRSARA